MEVEVRSQDSSTRKVLNDKVVQYKKSLASFRTDYEKTKIDVQRSSLVSDSRSGTDRERFLKTNEKYYHMIILFFL